MSSLRILRAADYSRMPWKNGAGYTQEVTRDHGQELDAFGWRLSIAEVAEPGPFSAFTNYQRVITVIEGAGMRLTVSGKQSRNLERLDAFDFDGGAVVECELLNGPIRDLNLIYSPMRYAARVQWIQMTGELNLLSNANTLLLFAAEGHAQLQDHERINQYDCLHLELNGDLQAFKINGQGAVCLIELVRR